MTIDKKIYRSGLYQDYYAQGTLVGNILYMSGQIGIDQEGNTPTDITDQTNSTLLHLSCCLPREMV
jgi:enamine deaminase RidA (YjgF/YER057c/UK114 family)